MMMFWSSNYRFLPFSGGFLRLCSGVEQVSGGGGLFDGETDDATSGQFGKAPNQRTSEHHKGI